MSPASAILALEDGRVWRGRSWGAAGESTGEMVFNTSMTGYQERTTRGDSRRENATERPLHIDESTLVSN
jgi:carbamoyl-phosphate synthase small subunit